MSHDILPTRGTITVLLQLYNLAIMLNGTCYLGTAVQLYMYTAICLQLHRAVQYNLRAIQ